MTLIIQLLGAAAGLTAFVTLVGGAMWWARFDALHLPADRSVALLPEAELVAVGVHALVPAMLAGLAAVLLLSLFKALDDQGDPRKRLWLALGALGIALVVAILVLFELSLWPQQLVMYAGIVAAGLAIVATARSRKGFRPFGWVVFAVFVALGGLLAVVRTTGTPKLEPAAVLLEPDDRGLSGFLVAETDDRLYLTPLPGEPFADAEITNVVAIPRDEIARIAVRAPAGVDEEHEGRELAATLLQDLRVAEAGPGEAPAQEVVTTVDPLTAFAPLVHLHVEEDAWPMSAREFLENASLMWAHDGPCTDWVAVEDDHIADRGTRFSGRYGTRPLVGGHRHRAADGRCRDTARAYDSSQHTRPFDRKGRAGGLAEREGFYLDLRDDRRGGDPTIVQPGSQRLLQNVPVYAETQPAGPRDARGIRITYWMFYGLSRPPGARRFVHEGDWERISVLLAPGAGRDQYVPQSVRFHFHSESRDVPWYAVRRALAEGEATPTHPVVFSAVGSHASYWRAGRYRQPLRLGRRRILTVADEAIACPRCPQWRTWENVLDARGQTWYGFGGAWGQVGSIAGTTGPLGPSRDKLGGEEDVPEQLAE